MRKIFVAMTIVVLLITSTALSADEKFTRNEKNNVDLTHLDFNCNDWIVEYRWTKMNNDIFEGYVIKESREIDLGEIDLSFLIEDDYISIFMRTEIFRGHVKNGDRVLFFFRNGGFLDVMNTSENENGEFQIRVTKSPVTNLLKNFSQSDLIRIEYSLGGNNYSYELKGEERKLIRNIFNCVDGGL